MLAYRKGIFPWFESDDFLLWWSPDPRMVLFPDQVKISKSMRAVLRKKQFEVTFNKAFDDVVEACAKVKRFGQNGTGSPLTYGSILNTSHPRTCPLC